MFVATLSMKTTQTTKVIKMTNLNFLWKLYTFYKSVFLDVSVLLGSSDF